MNISNAQIEDSGFYQMVCDESPTKKSFLGARYIKILNPPTPVYDFECFSHNWIQMECHWKMNDTYDHHVLYYAVYHYPVISEKSRCPSDRDEKYSEGSKKVNWRVEAPSQTQDIVKYDKSSVKTLTQFCRFENKPFQNIHGPSNDHEIRFFPDWTYYFTIKSYNEIGFILQNFTVTPKDIVKPDPPRVSVIAKENSIVIKVTSAVSIFPDTLALLFCLNLTSPALPTFWKLWTFHFSPRRDGFFYDFLRAGLNETKHLSRKENDSHARLDYTVFANISDGYNEIADLIFNGSRKIDRANISVSASTSNSLSGDNVILTLNHDTNTIVISNLYPYLTYNIEIKTKPIQNGYYSDPNTFSVRTLQDVPQYIPETSISGFELTRIYTENNNKLTLYWKSVPEAYRFGSNFHYDLYDWDTLVASNLTNNFYSLQLQRLDIKAHKFTITSGNTIGQGPHSAPIPFCQKDILPNPQNVRIIHYSQTAYSIAWNNAKSTNLIGSYTIYWCKIHQYIPYTCGPDIKWVRLDRNDTRILMILSQLIPLNDFRQIMTFNLTLDTNFLAGVAFEPKHSSFSSQGIVWGLCVLKYSQEPKSPKLNSESWTAISSRILRVEWWKETCQSEGGPVATYTLSYAPEHSPNQITVIAGIPYANATFAVLSNLTPHTTYLIWMRSVSIAGKTSANTNNIQATTLQDVPEDPCSNIRIAFKNESFIKFTWNGPLIKNGIIVVYRINLSSLSIIDIESDYDKNLTKTKSLSTIIKRKTSNRRIQKFETPFNYFIYRSLDWIGDQRYFITVSACNSVGCSPPNTPFIFDTPIKEPSKMEIPQYTLLNRTHITLKWKTPQFSNGPLARFDILVMKELKGVVNRSLDKVIPVYISNSSLSYFNYNLSVDCFDTAWQVGSETPYKRKDDLKYYVAIRAINYDPFNQVYRTGPFSHYKLISNACYEIYSLVGNESDIIIGSGSYMRKLYVIVGSLMCTILILFLLYFSINLKREKLLIWMRNMELKATLPWDEAEFQKYYYYGITNSNSQALKQARTNAHGGDSDPETLQVISNIDLYIMNSEKEAEQALNTFSPTQSETLFSPSFVQITPFSDHSNKSQPNIENIDEKEAATATEDYVFESQVNESHLGKDSKHYELSDYGSMIPSVNMSRRPSVAYSPMKNIEFSPHCSYGGSLS
ncbi:unnamed protein product [Gordionus sp. m RMFG-2023]